MTNQQRDLVRQAVAGDRDALGALLEAFGPEIEAGLTIGPPWTGSIDAADVMQVTYLEAFQHIRRFDVERIESFGGWLRQMAKNNLRDAIRGLEAKKKPSPRLQLDAYGGDMSVALFDVLTSGGGTPSRVVRREEAHERLREALRCLPPDYAKTVQLYDLEERPVEEVAAALGRSEGAVYMLRRRAHDWLEGLLGGASRILETGK